MITNFTIGKWTFAVDKLKTREYYMQNFKTESHDSQCRRNYCEFTKTLTPKESFFFSSMGLDPNWCHPDSIGLTKKNIFPTYGTFYVAAEVLEKPEEQSISLDEAIEKNFRLEWDDTSIVIDRYDIEVLFENSLFSPLPEGTPEGFIVLQFSIDSMPWLLPEKCTSMLFEPAKWWNVVGKIQENKQNSDLVKSMRYRKISSLITSLTNKKYLEMTERENKEIMEKWIRNFGGNKDFSVNKRLCMSNLRYNNYLWHLFSFGVASATEGEEATAKLKEISNTPCYITMNSENFTILIDDISYLALNKVEAFDDIVITAPDFSWTYCTTHEKGVGPYFCEREEIIE